MERALRVERRSPGTVPTRGGDEMRAERSGSLGWASLRSDSPIPGVHHPAFSTYFDRMSSVLPGLPVSRQVSWLAQVVKEEIAWRGPCAGLDGERACLSSVMPASLFA